MECDDEPFIHAGLPIPAYMVGVRWANGGRYYHKRSDVVDEPAIQLPFINRMVNASSMAGTDERPGCSEAGLVASPSPPAIVRARRLPILGSPHDTAEDGFSVSQREEDHAIDPERCVFEAGTVR